MKTYSQAELETKTLAQLKEIARTLNAEPQSDARLKSSWIIAILGTMPSKVSDLTTATEGKMGKRVVKVANQEVGYYIKTKSGFLAVKQTAERNIPQNFSSWEDVVSFFQPTSAVVEEAPVEEVKTEEPSQESTPSDKKVTCKDCPLFQSFDDGSGRGLCCGADRVAREHHEQTQDCLHMVEAAEENTPSDKKAEEEPNQYTLLPAGAADLMTAYHVRHKDSLIGMIFNMHKSNTWQCGDGFDYKYPRDASNALQELTEAPLLKTHPHRYQSPDESLVIVQQGELAPHEKLWKNNKDKYYYRTWRDAQKETGPVAMRFDDVRVGDKIFILGQLRIVSNITQVPHLGIEWTKLICEDGDSVKAPWYSHVSIAG